MSALPLSFSELKNYIKTNGVDLVSVDAQMQAAMVGNGAPHPLGVIFAGMVSTAYNSVILQAIFAKKLNPDKDTDADIAFIETLVACFNSDGENLLSGAHVKAQLITQLEAYKVETGAQRTYRTELALQKERVKMLDALNMQIQQLAVRYSDGHAVGELLKDKLAAHAAMMASILAFQAKPDVQAAKKVKRAESETWKCPECQNTNKTDVCMLCGSRSPFDEITPELNRTESAATAVSLGSTTSSRLASPSPSEPPKQQPKPLAVAQSPLQKAAAQLAATSVRQVPAA